MDIEIKDCGTMSLAIQKHLEESINTCIEVITHKIPTPPSNTLFEVNESNLLSEENSEILHHIVEKLLYVSKRARVDLSTAVTFLYTRVSKSTGEHWEKHHRLLHYLKVTINMKRIWELMDLSV